MSFSSDVKEELSRQFSPARHCQIAEVAAIISMCGQISRDENSGFTVKIHTENLAVARKYFTLLKKTFNIKTEISIRRNVYLKKSRTYTIFIKKAEDALRVLQAVKLLDVCGSRQKEMPLTSHLVIQKTCCRRAFIRGAFLAAGSISDPEKFYHFEIVCSTMSKAEQLRDVIRSFEIEAKIVKRKKYFVVYIKEGAQIVDILNVMEAHVSLMNLENVRILKDMRNSVNRQVNCETANIHKTVSAAVKQIEDIRYIQEAIGFEQLTEGLEEIAVLRLQYPEATLKELGMLLNPQVGKSGVNHRLRKLSSIAEELRQNKEEKL